MGEMMYFLTSHEKGSVISLHLHIAYKSGCK